MQGRQLARAIYFCSISKKMSYLWILAYKRCIELLKRSVWLNYPRDKFSLILVNWAKHKNTFPALTVNVRELTLAQSVQYNQAVSCHYVGKYALCDCWAPICCINEITSEQSHKSLPDIFISVINLMEDLTSRFSLQRSWFQSFKENFCLERWKFCSDDYKRIDSIWAFNTGSLVQKKI